MWRTAVGGGQRDRMKIERSTRIYPGKRWEGCAWRGLLREAKKSSIDWYWCYNDTEDALSQPFCLSVAPQAGLGKKKKRATFNCETMSQSGWGSLGPRVYEGLARPWSFPFLPTSLLGTFLQLPDCQRYQWKWKSLSRVWLFATPWTIQPMEFSRPEYCSG